MKTKIFIAIIILLVVATAIFSVISNQTTNPAEKVFSTPTIVVPKPQIAGPRINISGISTNDFLKTAKQIEATSEFYAIYKDSYHVLYNSSDNSFSINVLSSPFEIYRELAENDFIQILGISKEDACRLNVIEGTPHFVNPNESGKDFSLSFCK